MKVAISIPNPIFEEAEQVSRRLGLSRSEFYTKAVSDLVRDHRSQNVRARLDDVYGDQQAKLDPILDQLQAEALREDW